MYEPMAKLSLDSETRAWADDIIARLEGEFEKLVELKNTIKPVEPEEETPEDTLAK